MAGFETDHQMVGSRSRRFRFQSSLFSPSCFSIMHDSHDSSLRERESACRSNVKSVVHSWEPRQRPDTSILMVRPLLLPGELKKYNEMSDKAEYIKLTSLLHFHPQMLD